MKKYKLFYFLLVLIILVTNLFARISVSPDTLPKKYQEFIKINFPNDNIMYMEKDNNEFNVNLSSGIEITFLNNGEWKNADGKYKLLPTKFIPPNVINSINQLYPDTGITQIEKRLNDYKIKLENMTEVYIDFNGKVESQKFDD